MSCLEQTDDTYNAADNAYGCWKLAIRSMRLDAIKSGKAVPRMDDAEEVEAVGYDAAAMAERLGKIRHCVANAPSQLVQRK